MSHLIRRLAPLLAFVLTTGAVPAEENPELYKKWHDVCAKGGSDEIDAIIKKYEARLAQDPKDQLAKAYLGSACALRAKTGFWGPTKLKFLKRGRELLDAAVHGAPDNARVRLVRAISYYKVPEKFGVRPTSLADFNILVPIAKKPAGRLTPQECQVTLYYAWCLNRDLGKPAAQELKKACHQLAPDSHYGKLTR